MTNILKYIMTYKEFAKEFFEWYKENYTISLANFIKLPTIMQLPIIQEYIVYTYNISLHHDVGSIVLYYYRPEYNEREVEELYKKEGKLTFTIFKEFDLPILDYKDSFERAIRKSVELVNQPF